MFQKGCIIFSSMCFLLLLKSIVSYQLASDIIKNHDHIGVPSIFFSSSVLGLKLEGKKNKATRMYLEEAMNLNKPVNLKYSSGLSMIKPNDMVSFRWPITTPKHWPIVAAEQNFQNLDQITKPPTTPPSYKFELDDENNSPETDTTTKNIFFGLSYCGQPSIAGFLNRIFGDTYIQISEMERDCFLISVRDGEDDDYVYDFLQYIVNCYINDHEELTLFKQQGPGELYKLLKLIILDQFKSFANLTRILDRLETEMNYNYVCVKTDTVFDTNGLTSAETIFQTYKRSVPSDNDIRSKRKPFKPIISGKYHVVFDPPSNMDPPSESKHVVYYFSKIKQKRETTEPKLNESIVDPILDGVETTRKQIEQFLMGLISENVPFKNLNSICEQISEFINRMSASYRKINYVLEIFPMASNAEALEMKIVKSLIVNTLNNKVMCIFLDILYKIFSTNPLGDNIPVEHLDALIRFLDHERNITTVQESLQVLRNLTSRNISSIEDLLAHHLGRTKRNIPSKLDYFEVRENRKNINDLAADVLKNETESHLMLDGLKYQAAERKIHELLKEMNDANEAISVLTLNTKQILNEIADIQNETITVLKNITESEKHDNKTKRRILDFLMTLRAFQNDTSDLNYNALRRIFGRHKFKRAVRNVTTDVMKRENWMNIAENATNTRDINKILQTLPVSDSDSQELARSLELLYNHTSISTEQPDQEEKALLRTQFKLLIDDFKNNIGSQSQSGYMPENTTPTSYFQDSEVNDPHVSFIQPPIIEDPGVPTRKKIPDEKINLEYKWDKFSFPSQFTIPNNNASLDKALKDQSWMSEFNTPDIQLDSTETRTNPIPSITEGEYNDAADEHISFITYIPTVQPIKKSQSTNITAIPNVSTTPLPKPTTVAVTRLTRKNSRKHFKTRTSPLPTRLPTVEEINMEFRRPIHTQTSRPRNKRAFKYAPTFSYANYDESWNWTMYVTTKKPYPKYEEKSAITQEIESYKFKRSVNSNSRTVPKISKTVKIQNLNSKSVNLNRSARSVLFGSNFPRYNKRQLKKLETKANYIQAPINHEYTLQRRLPPTAENIFTSLALRDDAFRAHILRIYHRAKKHRIKRSNRKSNELDILLPSYLQHFQVLNDSIYQSDLVMHGYLNLDIPPKPPTTTTTTTTIKPHPKISMPDIINGYKYNVNPDYIDEILNNATVTTTSNVKPFGLFQPHIRSKRDNRENGLKKVDSELFRAFAHPVGTTDFGLEFSESRDHLSVLPYAKTKYVRSSMATIPDVYNQTEIKNITMQYRNRNRIPAQRRMRQPNNQRLSQRVKNLRPVHYASIDHPSSRITNRKVGYYSSDLLNKATSGANDEPAIRVNTKTPMYQSSMYQQLDRESKPTLNSFDLNRISATQAKGINCQSNQSPDFYLLPIIDDVQLARTADWSKVPEHYKQKLK